MSRSMIAKLTLAATIALGAGVTPLVATAPSASAAPCATGTWSSTSQGRPATLAAGSATGMYLWHDNDGWHLRVTHPGGAKVVFRGTIDSVGTGPFDIAQVATESHDLVTVTPAVGKIHYRMVNYGHIDGLDFKVGCVKRFKVQGTIDGAPIPTSNVYLGSGSTNPTSVPFTMERS